MKPARLREALKTDPPLLAAVDAFLARLDADVSRTVEMPMIPPGMILDRGVLTVPPPPAP